MKNVSVVEVVLVSQLVVLLVIAYLLAPKR